MSRLFVCSLADMPDFTAQLRPDRVITLLQPEWQPPTPLEIEPQHHHRVVINDITEPLPDQILPNRTHVEDLLAFLGNAREASLLIHCWAGISRSTAAALIAMVLDAPGREREAVETLRARAPWAQPNRLILELADEVLGRRGALIHAYAAMEPAIAPPESRGLLELPRSLGRPE